MRSMRELKFRVWNNRYNEFIRPDYWLIGFCYPLDGRIAALTTSGKPMEDCIIEQYTGLKDKNGKEIYEGDIVDYNDDGDCIGYVVYNAPSYEIMEKTGFTCWLKGSPHQRVIGNIHENPELLDVSETGQIMIKLKPSPLGARPYRRANITLRRANERRQE